VETAAGESHFVSAPAVANSDSVPFNAVRKFRSGRYWRAAAILSTAWGRFAQVQVIFLRREDQCRPVIFRVIYKLNAHDRNPIVMLYLHTSRIMRRGSVALASRPRVLLLAEAQNPPAPPASGQARCWRYFECSVFTRLAGLDESRMIVNCPLTKRRDCRPGA